MFQYIYGQIWKMLKCVNVYALLKENYTEVEWVSENAKADGVNSMVKRVWAMI
jgi:hypothetical protein